jgi:hypothetical protein
MARLQIKREVLENTKDRGILSVEERAAVDRVLDTSNKGAQCHVNVGELPVSFLRSLLDDHRLTANQRAAVIMHLYGMSVSDVDRDKVYDTRVSSPVEFGSSFALLGAQVPNCEMFLNGRWYPVTMHANFYQDYDKKTRVALNGVITMCERNFNVNHPFRACCFSMTTASGARARCARSSASSACAAFRRSRATSTSSSCAPNGWRARSASRR